MTEPKKYEPKALHFYQFGADLGAGVQFSINGSIYEGQTDEEVRKEMDRMRGFIDRERAKHELAKAVEEFDKTEYNLTIAMNEIDSLSEKLKRKGQLKTEEQSRLSQFRNNTNVYKKQIEKLKEVIDERKRIIAADKHVPLKSVSTG